MSSDIDLTYEHREPVLLQCIPLRIYMSRLFQFSPRLFSSPNVNSTLRSLSREVFSRRGSAVGPGSITMKPTISCYACRSQNLDLFILFMLYFKRVIHWHESHIYNMKQLICPLACAVYGGNRECHGRTMHKRHTPVSHI